MSVITISRGSFSGGGFLAECLANKLGYRSISREIIIEKAAAYGVSQRELIDALQKPPSFFERFTHKRYLYLTLLQTALAEEVRTGRAVYHGNAGHLLLAAGPPILRTRLIAPLPMRVKVARERLRLSEEEAHEEIQRRDDARRKWTQYVYGADWSDPSLYDIVVNLESIPLSRACDTIVSLARSQPCHKFGPECQAGMDDLVLAAQVKRRLALTPSTQHLEFVVTSKGGVVFVRVPAAELVRDVESVAIATPGVKEVVLDEVASMPEA